MKNIVFFLGLAFLCIGSSCSNENSSSDDEPQVNSSWVLKNTSGGITGINDNFVNGDVIWDFDSSNKSLKVTKNVSTTGSGIPAGVYTYSVKKEGKKSLLVIKHSDVVYATLSYEFLNENGVVFKDEAIADGFQFTFVKNCGETIFCTLEAKAALNVYVKLGNSSTSTTDGVTVIAKSGNYTESLTPSVNKNPSFTGAYEKAGNYIITVSKSGYKTYTSDRVIVSRDCCHVLPQTMNVVLQLN
nr:hypothetical protein [uncultured Flavobacterium sp.]